MVRLPAKTEPPRPPDEMWPAGPMDELAMAAVIPIGWVVVLSLILSFAAAIGVNLQKLSMNNEERRPGHLQRIPYL